jgi:ribonuclease HI
LGERFKIYTDGAARGNPGPSASGFMVVGNAGNVRLECWYNGIRTNNYAEYTAVIRALEWCQKNLPEGVDMELYSDSELVIKQINKEYKVRAKELKPLNAKANKIISGIKSLRISNLPREDKNISKVDKSLNNLLDEMESGSKSGIQRTIK